MLLQWTTKAPKTPGFYYWQGGRMMGLQVAVVQVTAFMGKTTPLEACELRANGFSNAPERGPAFLWGGRWAGPLPQPYFAARQPPDGDPVGQTDAPSTPGPWQWFDDELYGADGARVAEAVRQRDKKVIGASLELRHALHDLVNVMTGLAEGETAALHNALAVLSKAYGAEQWNG